MGKLNLYQIDAEYLQLADQLIETGGELTPELEEALEINREQLEIKGRGYGFVIKELDDEIERIKAEKERLDKLIKSRTKAAERLKFALKQAMELHDINVIETDTLKISLRNSESVEIINASQLDPDYMVSKTTVTPDKAAIKAALKAGEIVDGAIMQQNRNLQIK